MIRETKKQVYWNQRIDFGASRIGHAEDRPLWPGPVPSRIILLLGQGLGLVPRRILLFGRGLWSAEGCVQPRFLVSRILFFGFIMNQGSWYPDVFGHVPAHTCSQRPRPPRRLESKNLSIPSSRPSGIGRPRSAARCSRSAQRGSSRSSGSCSPRAGCTGCS